MSEREQLEQAIAALEAQRAILGDAVVNVAVAPMREKLASLKAPAAPAPQQRKQVTVLFADVSGFTAMSETLDAEEVSATMNALWSRLDGAILQQGGRIDKHIGDAVMALFGAPTAHEDDPERAIRAALAMQQEIRAFMPDAQGQPRLRMRIGLNTGPVLLGAVGTTSEYTAMGDTVNLASRLEHAAPVGGILISHDTYRHVRGVFDVLPLEPITVKGKAEPVQVYVVRAAKPKAFRVTTRGVEGVETRTIGREAELQQMQAAYIAARDEQRTHLVSVVAEAGMGKSRLLYEFTNWLELQPERSRLFRGRATQEMSRVPFSLIRDLLATRFEIQDSDRATTAREKLERGLLGLVGDRHPEADAWAHFIGHQIGFDFSASPHLQGILGDARQIRDRAFLYLTRFFAAIAEVEPVVILLEDIHWADDSSLDWVDHLLQTQPDLRLSLLGMTRPTLFEQRPDWGGGPGTHVRVDLKPLTLDDSRRLVAEILRKAPEVPASLVDMIVTRAEGSPFYVEELIKVLIDDGAILTGDEVWQVKPERLAGVRVPATLTGILQARLDSLPEPERRALQQAAVIGRVFWDSILERLSEGPEVATDYLTTLNRRELIFRREDSAFIEAREYIFKHAILHDVTYESVLKRLRRLYHIQVAEALIELASERAGEFAGRIAEHFERAEDWARAAEWHGRAGQQARTAFAPQAAIAYFQKALSFWDRVPDTSPAQRAKQIEAHQGLGDALVVQARPQEAIQAFNAMRELAVQTGDVRAQALAWYGLAQAHGDLGDWHLALQDSLQAQAQARAAGGRAELAHATWSTGRAQYRLGDSAAALAQGEEVVALALALGDRQLQARGLNLLGAVHYSQGRYDAAQENWSEALEVFRATGDRNQMMSVANNLGVVAEGRGDNAQAHERYAEALRVAREVGHRDGEITFLGNLAEVRVKLGEYAAAEVDLRQVIARMTETASAWNLSAACRGLAEACLAQDKVEEALAAGQRALATGQDADNQEHVIAAWRVLGQVACRLGRDVSLAVKGSPEPRVFSAQDCFSESLRLSLEFGMEGEQARTLREWARCELAAGNAVRGTALWQEARAMFRRLGAELEVAGMAEVPRHPVGGGH